MACHHGHQSARVGIGHRQDLTASNQQAYHLRAMCTAVHYDHDAPTTCTMHHAPQLVTHHARHAVYHALTTCAMHDACCGPVLRDAPAPACLPAFVCCDPGVACGLAVDSGWGGPPSHADAIHSSSTLRAAAAVVVFDIACLSVLLQAPSVGPMRMRLDVG
jgi:hypothetical protein